LHDDADAGTELISANQDLQPRHVE